MNRQKREGGHQEDQRYHAQRQREPRLIASQTYPTDGSSKITKSRFH